MGKNLNEDILNIIEETINSGFIEKTIEDKFKNILEDIIKEELKWGSSYKALKTKIENVLVPAIEGFDFSKYITKLDTVLTDVIKETSLIDNQKILNNFKDLMIEPKKEGVKTSEIFDEYAKYVAESVDTSNLEIDYNNDISYVPVEARMSIVDECNTSGIFEYKKIILTCEEDEDLNMELNLTRYRNNRYFTLNLRSSFVDINSLRYVDSFTIYLLKLDRAFTKIYIDKVDIEDYIRPEKEPEPWE